MADTAFLTIVTNSHLGYAITLAKSLARAMPGTRLRIYIADRWDPAILPDLAEAEFIAADQCELNGYVDMARRYNAFEFATALKAPCILHALDQTGVDSVIYLDSDIWVLGSFDPVIEALAAGTDCILTPHITAPYKAVGIPDEDLYLQVGLFNLGFAAFSNRQPARSFLSWWAAKKRVACTINLHRGLFGDQGYCNLAPVFIERFQILRVAGFNIAYWNLDQRQISKNASGQYFANDQPIRFVHFSGASIATPNVISKFQNRFTKSNVGLFAELLDAYLAEVKSNDVFNATTFSRLVWIYAKPVGHVAAMPAEVVLERSIYSVKFILGNLARRVLLGKRRLTKYWQQRGLGL
jgi:hypothetical protein